jgi:Arc/MetJ-type ribon-helix-helix transcriptional regulator
MQHAVHWQWRTEEIETLETLRRRLGLHGVLLNRSEVVRTALRYLAEQQDADLVSAADGMSRFKPGRRSKRDDSP